MNLPFEENVCTVSQITREIKTVLENGFVSLWIEGEISNLKKHASGHLYFSLKDSEAQISCVMWRGRNQSLLFLLEDGMKILVQANLTVYERQGRYQLDVLRIRPIGLGELQQAFETLKRRLDAEGLFLSEHKKPLPLFPESIGIVTSPTGAAIRDITTIIGRRFPSVQMILRPVRVQGQTAGDEIAEAIREFNAFGKVDVLIVGRGGGSLEDLWAFNEEVVARAIYQSSIPVISAVGHEIDFSISDFVADFRAPTPSAAAEMVVKDRDELFRNISHLQDQMVHAVQGSLNRYRERLETFRRSYGFRLPMNVIREYNLRFDDFCRNLENTILSQTRVLRTDVRRLEEKLQVLNPHAVLRRGYQITSHIPSGQIVSRSSDLKETDKIRVLFSDGAVRSTVYEVESSQEEK